MAFAWMYFGANQGTLLRNALTQLEQYRNNFFDTAAAIFGVRDMMIQMRSGDGSDPSHYGEVTSRFAFINDASSKAAFDEIASACGSLQNGSATADQINAALSQLFARLRG